MYCLKSPLNFISSLVSTTARNAERSADVCWAVTTIVKPRTTNPTDLLGAFAWDSSISAIHPQISRPHRKPCGAVRFRRRGRAKRQSDVFVEVVGIGVCQELFCNLPRRSPKIERFVLSAQELVDGVPKCPFSSHLSHTHAPSCGRGVTCIASH